MKPLRLAASLLALSSVLFVACSSGPAKPQPSPLQPVTALVPARQAWSLNVGALDPIQRVSVVEQQVFVANAAGVVYAIDGQSGQMLWRAELGSRLSSGVGSDGVTAAVVTADNMLVAVRASGEVWRTRLTSRVFTAPLVAGQRVFVLGADRSVSAFDGSNGARLWQQTPRLADALVLQQPGVLAPWGNTLLAGLSGRLTALDPAAGRPVWEAPVATPRGVNEIERLVDLVEPLARRGNVVCARAFQSSVACVDATQGAVRWSQSSDGFSGLSMDADQVYGSARNGRVVAWQVSDGQQRWAVDHLLHRGVSAPLAAGRSIIVGDSQGYVHLLSRDDGRLLNRLMTDGSAIVGGPVLAGNTLVAVTRNGGVFGWRPE
jgi:outer membrane protein assembly factor BamB